MATFNVSTTRSRRVGYLTSFHGLDIRVVFVPAGSAAASWLTVFVVDKAARRHICIETFEPGHPVYDLGLATLDADDPMPVEVFLDLLVEQTSEAKNPGLGQAVGRVPLIIEPLPF